MAEIALTRGYVAIVDDDLADWLNQWSWTYSSRDHIGRLGYAVRAVYAGGKAHMIYMHRQIAAAPADLHVDHANRDRLDNRRANLRICESRDNARNIGLTTANTSGFKGARQDPRTGRWIAQITCDGHNYHLGVFDGPIAAARAYDRAARAFFGEFAATNFPEETEADFMPPRRSRSAMSAQRERIRAMSAQGLRQFEIARELGIPKSTVRGALKVGT